MKCPNCGNEMVQSRAGWLCVSCGHIEPNAAPAGPTAAIATGKDGHDQMRAAAVDAAAASTAPPSADEEDPTDDHPATETQPATADEPATTSSDQTDSAAAPTDDATDPATAPEPPKPAAPWEDPAGPPAESTPESISEAPAADSTDLDAVAAAVESQAKSALASPAEPDEAPAEQPSEPEADPDDKPDETTDASTPDETDGPDEAATPEQTSSGELTAGPVASPVGDKPSEDESDPEVAEPMPTIENHSDQADKPAEPEAPAEPASVEDQKPEPDTGTPDKPDYTPPAMAAHAPRIASDLPKPEDDKDAEPKATDDDATPPAEPAEEAPAKVPAPHASALHKSKHRKHAKDKEAAKEPVEDQKPELPAEPEPAAPAAQLPAPSTESTPAPDEPEATEPKPTEEAEAVPVPVTDTPSSEAPEPSQADAAEPADPIDSPDAKPESLEQVEHDIAADDKSEVEDEAAETAQDAGIPTPSPVADTAPASSPTEPTPATPDTAASVPAAPTLADLEEKSAAQTAAAAAAGTGLATTPTESGAIAGSAPAMPSPIPKPLTSVTPVTHPAPWSPVNTVITIVIILAILIIGAVGYLFVLGPKVALGSYLQRLASSHGSTVNAVISYQGSDARAAVSAYGWSDFSNAADPELDLNVTGQLSGTTDANTQASGAVAGEAKLISGNLYFKLTSPQTIGQLMGLNFADEWYTDPVKSSWSQCTGSSQSPLIALASHLNAQNGSFAGVSTLSGSPALHYKGSVSAASLATAMSAANAKVPAACKLGNPSPGLGVTYDLWQSWSADHLVLNFADTAGNTTSVTLDTADYNHAHAISAPASAKAMPTANGVLGASTTKVTPATLAMPSVAVINADREVALAQYVQAYSATKVGGYFSTTPPAVTVSARDPQTGAGYVITTTPPTAAGQIWYAAGHQCSGFAIAPGKALTHYLALYTLLDGSTIPYCRNVQ